jgi:ribosomal protein S18 acetylase RimI-like enzyme
MPEVDIRPILASDLSALVGFDLSYSSTHVWQMERFSDENMVGSHFREVRLPREAKVEYPRPAAQVFDDFQNPAQLILVASMVGRLIGYVRISTQVAPRTAWVKDWAVQDGFRRKGIGAALLLAALEWSMEEGCRRTVVETQSKNYPAIKLVRKLGFEYAGFHDQYYSNQDIALFFARSLR